MTTAASAPENPADILVAPLRRDVVFLPAPADEGGSPAGMLHDTFRDTFDRFGWREREILKRLTRPLRLGELHRDLREHTAIDVGLDELAGFVHFLHRRGLLQSASHRPPREFLEESRQARTGSAAWLFRHYLFFRIPLFRPDAFLRRTLWLPALLASAPAKAVFLLALAALPFLMVPRLGMLGPSLTPFLALRGAVWMSLALAALKIVHEFSHAYAAAARGVRVRTMGVAFMVLFPIPYCDVTGAWRLSRRERLAVDFAGVRSELVLAVFSLCLWCVALPGTARDICLVVGTASVLSTLLTNLNPGMRFDGYYLMSDLTGIDNLGSRASALLRHYLHTCVLGIREKNPEAGMAPRKRFLVSVYAAYATLYRLGLYFGVALLVYASMPKVIGVALFAVEIYAFIARPALREASLAAAKLRKGGGSPRLLVFVLLFAVLLLWFALPLPRRIALAACVTSDAQTLLLTPDYGRVTLNNLSRGAVIPAGGTLFAMENGDLDADIARTELELAEATMSLDGVSGNPEARERLRDSLAREERLRSLLASRRARRNMLTFRADVDSVVLDAAPGLKPGVYLGAGKAVGRVISLNADLSVTTYIPEEKVNLVAVGDAVAFVPDDNPGVLRPGRIVAISPINSTTIEEPSLAAPHGGGMAITSRPGAPLAPATPVYRAEIALDAPDAPGLRLGQTGRVRLRGRPVSLARETWDWLLRTVLRESGL